MPNLATTPAEMSAAQLSKVPRVGVILFGEGGPIWEAFRRGLGELAAKHRLPTMLPGGYTNAGGLITYGTSIVDTIAPMARYVDKILKGAKCADLPIEVITRRELVVNLKTAREIGATIPPDVLKRADQVIE